MTDTKEKLAFDAVRASCGTEDGEFGIDLFISHHLEELGAETWISLLGKAKPMASEILDIMILRDCWNEGLSFDFTLPNDVTNYVVSVLFDKDGAVEDISMES